MEMNKIHCMDCLEGMRKLPDNSVDLVVTDPPYNIKKDSWDDIEDYENWLKQVFLEVQRVLKDNGSFYWFHNNMEFISDMIVWLRKDTSFIFRQFITWEKYQTNKQYYGRTVIQGVNNTHKRNYYKMAEYILFYTFQEEFQGHSKIFNNIRNWLNQERIKAGFKTFKDVNAFLGVSTLGGGMAAHYFSDGNKIWELPTREAYEKLQTTGRFRKQYEELKGEYEELHEEYKKLLHVFNFVKPDITTTWLFPPAPKKGHITPKPEDIMRRIILHSSKKEQVVLDPFMGSGTTAVACQQTGRKFIGFEISQEYCEMAWKRLAQRSLL